MDLDGVFARKRVAEPTRAASGAPATSPHTAPRELVFWVGLGVGAGSLALVTASDLAAAVTVALAMATLIALWFLGHARDGVALLTFFLFTLILIPAPYAVVGLRSIGAPALLFAAALGFCWLLERAWPGEPRRPVRRPLHILFCLFAIVWLVSYAVAAIHPLDAQEARGMDRSLLVLLGFAGVALTASDGTPNRDRLNAMVRRVVYAGAYAALVGILQSRDVLDLARFALPGLEIHGDEATTYDIRSGFERISSVTLHPIEFASVLGMVFPLSLHTLIHARSRRERKLMILCTVLIGVAMPMAVTRTGVLGFAVGTLVLIPSWPKHLRVRFYKWAIPGVIALRLAVPGLLGTLRSLFVSAGADSSVTGRTDDFPIVLDLIARKPLFGLGPGMFDPVKYFYLDNQVLGTAVQLGGLGVVVMLALVLGSAVIGDVAARRATSASDRLLGRALAAAVLAGFATFFTFDALSFPVFSGILFLVMGMIGALHRLVSTDVADAVAASTTEPLPGTPAVAAPAIAP